MSERDSDIIDLQVLMRIWLRWGWIALILAAVGAYVGLRDARKIVPVYEAATIVMPDAGGGGGVEDALAQISSVFGSGSSSRGGSRTFDRFKLMVGSVQLAERLQERYGLLQMIYESQWDEQNATWIPPSDEAWEERFRYRKFFGLDIPEWIAPDTQLLAKYLGGAFQFENENGTDFFRIIFRDRDPEFALFLLEAVYAEADRVLRESDLEESRKRRQYVEGQLAQARLLDSKQALIGILTNEERRAMLLESDLPYAARILEPPFVSTQPSTPDYRQKVLFPAVLFGALGLFFITLVALYRRQSK